MVKVPRPLELTPMIMLLALIAPPLIVSWPRLKLPMNRLLVMLICPPVTNAVPVAVARLAMRRSSSTVNTPPAIVNVPCPRVPLPTSSTAATTVPLEIVNCPLPSVAEVELSEPRRTPKPLLVATSNA